MSEPRSLTQQEAEQRSRLIDVHRYDIEVDLRELADGQAFLATSTVTFSCGIPGASTFVDCGAEVVSATLNGSALGTTPAEAAEGRLDLKGLQPDNVLVVESVQRSTSQAAGVQRSVDKSDGETYVWTSFEPDDARRAWACFDQPDLKAVHALRVTAPSHWVVLSNTRPDTVEDLAVGRRWHFPDTPPLSTYVPVIDAGPFHEIRVERGGYQLGLFARRSLAGQLDRDAAEIFELTAQGLAFYGEQFDLPFPQRTYDQVFVPDMGGAMENWGCVTWSDRFMYRTRPTQQEREIRARVLLHEMAHMWFGDLVTLRWWDDLWLNESFAEWASCWAATEATEFTDVWASVAAADKLAAYAADLAPSTHPITQPVPDLEAAKASFDSITYLKGSSVLRQLFSLVGHQALRTALRSYFHRHAYANATFADMVTELEQASGRDLSAWTAGWLGSPGTDRLTLERVDGVNGTAAGGVLRAVGPDGSAPRQHRLDIGMYDRSGAALVRRGAVEVETTGESTPVPELEPADLWMVNDGDLTFASTRPDPESLAVLLTSAGSLPSPLARALTVATVRDLLLAAEIPAADVVTCLSDILLHETAVTVVEPFLQLATLTAERWSPLGSRRELLAVVADTCLQLAERPDTRRIALRSLAATATIERQLELLRAEQGEDVDLRWRVLIRAAELGQLDPAEVAQLEATDPDPEAWVRAVAVRAAQPDSAAKQEVWAQVFDDAAVPSSALREIGSAFWRRGRAEVTEPFVERYAESLATAGERGMLAALSGSSAMFPWGAEDPRAVSRLVGAVASDDVSPVVRRVVVEFADQLGRMMTSRGHHAT